MSRVPHAQRPQGRLHRIARLLQNLLRSMERSMALDLPDPMTIEGFFADNLLIHHTIQQGIPYHLFEAIRDRSPIGENEWATLLGTSSKTLQRRAKDNRPFKGLHAQRIVQVFEALYLGLQTFDDDQRLAFWLHQPNRALSACTPIKLLTDTYGTNLVLDELHQLRHGLLA